MRRRAVSHRPQTISSLLGLAPGGGYLATRITARAGGLLHHLFTITLTPKGGGLFVSVALIRQVTLFSVFPSTRDEISPPRVLSDAVLHGVRTFLDPDNAGPRLPDQPEEMYDTRKAEGGQHPKGGHFGKRH